MPTEPNLGEMQFTPVPTSYQLAAAQIGSQPAVILRIQTPDTCNVTYWDVDQALQMAEKMKDAARMAKTGLVIPQNNGEGGTVDLSAYRETKGDDDA